MQPGFRLAWLEKRAGMADSAMDSWYRLLGSTPDPVALTARTHCGMVVCDPNQYAAMTAARAIRPGQPWLAYIDMGSTRGYHHAADGPPPAGMQFDDVPDEAWFLHDTAGSTSTHRILWRNFNQHYAMDYSNPGYQALWLSNTLEYLETLGSDCAGVYIDNNLVSYYLALSSAALGNFTWPANMPANWDTQPEVLANTLGFLGAVTSTLRGAGWIVGGNCSGTRSVQAVGHNLIGESFVGTELGTNRLLDFGHEEFFINTSASPEGTGVHLPQFNVDRDWRAQVAEIEAAEANGGLMLCTVETTWAHADPCARDVAVYFLMGTNGASMLCMQDDDGIGVEPPYDWLHNATGPRYQISGELWGRDYAHGRILLDAGTTTPNPTSLPLIGNNYHQELGGVYRTLDGVRVSAVDLTPGHVSVLKSTSRPAC